MPGRLDASSDLPAPGGADHQQIMPTRRGDLQRALGGFLALYLLEIGADPGLIDHAWFGWPQQGGALEMVE